MGAAAGMESQYTELIRESKRALDEKRELKERHETLEKMFGNKDYYADVVMLENKKHERQKQLRGIYRTSATCVYSSLVKNKKYL